MKVDVLLGLQWGFFCYYENFLLFCLAKCYTNAIFAS